MNDHGDTENGRILTREITDRVIDRAASQDQPQKLNFSRNWIRNIDPTAFQKLGASVIKINLSANLLGSEALSKLLPCSLPILRELWLGSNQIETLSTLSPMPTLEVLKVDCNHLEDCLLEFTHLATFRSLSTLDLSGNPLCKYGEYSPRAIDLLWTISTIIPQPTQHPLHSDGVLEPVIQPGPQNIGTASNTSFFLTSTDSYRDNTSIKEMCNFFVRTQEFAPGKMLSLQEHFDPNIFSSAESSLQNTLRNSNFKVFQTSAERKQMIWSGNFLEQTNTQIQNDRSDSHTVVGKRDESYANQYCRDDRYVNQTVVDSRDDRYDNHTAEDCRDDRYVNQTVVDSRDDRYDNQPVADRSNDRYDNHTADDRYVNHTVEDMRDDRYANQSVADRSNDREGSHTVEDRRDAHTVEDRKDDRYANQSLADRSKDREYNHTVEDMRDDRYANQTLADRSDDQFDNQTVEDRRDAHTVEDRKDDRYANQTLADRSDDQFDNQTVVGKRDDRYANQTRRDDRYDNQTVVDQRDYRYGNQTVVEKRDDRYDNQTVGDKRDDRNDNQTARNWSDDRYCNQSVRDRSYDGDDSQTVVDRSDVREDNQSVVEESEVSLLKKQVAALTHLLKIRDDALSKEASLVGGLSSDSAEGREMKGAALLGAWRNKCFELLVDIAFMKEAHKVTDTSSRLRELELLSNLEVMRVQLNEITVEKEVISAALGVEQRTRRELEAVLADREHVIEQCRATAAMEASERERLALVAMRASDRSYSSFSGREASLLQAVDKLEGYTARLSLMRDRLASAKGILEFKEVKMRNESASVEAMQRVWHRDRKHAELAAITKAIENLPKTAQKYYNEGIDTKSCQQSDGADQAAQMAVRDIQTMLAAVKPVLVVPCALRGLRPDCEAVLRACFRQHDNGTGSVSSETFMAAISRGAVERAMSRWMGAEAWHEGVLFIQHALRAHCRHNLSWGEFLLFFVPSTSNTSGLMDGSEVDIHEDHEIVDDESIQTTISSLDVHELRCECKTLMIERRKLLRLLVRLETRLGKAQNAAWSCFRHQITELEAELLTSKLDAERAKDRLLELSLASEDALLKVSQYELQRKEHTAIERNNQIETEKLRQKIVVLEELSSSLASKKDSLIAEKLVAVKEIANLKRESAISQVNIAAAERMVQRVEKERDMREASFERQVREAQRERNMVIAQLRHLDRIGLPKNNPPLKTTETRDNEDEDITYLVSPALEEENSQRSLKSVASQAHQTEGFHTPAISKLGAESQRSDDTRKRIEALSAITRSLMSSDSDSEE